MNEYCVVGNPIAHSKSPVIHEQFAKTCDRHIQYKRELIEKGLFVESLLNMFSNGLMGANVTVPFKEEAFKLCNSISDRAEVAGAVNTIINNGKDGLLGDNTDGIGLVKDLTQNHSITLRGRKILVVGAGGASRGILKPLLEERPASIIIANRTHEKACDLAKLFKQYGDIECCEFENLDQHRFNLVLNASSGSLNGDVPPIPAGAISRDCVFYDLMYANEATAFLVWGRELGLTQLFDGLGMLVEQAAESFYLWEGVRPDTQSAIKMLRPD